MNLRQKIMVAGAVVAMFNLMLLIVFGDNGLVELSRLRERNSRWSGKTKPWPARTSIYTVPSVG
jgi:hypothetical protein